MNRYFKREEFACKCGCGFAVVDYELLEVLTSVREHFGNAVIINSSARCEAHNKAVGGADGSKHKLGIAADIFVKGFTAENVYSYLDSKYPKKYGIGKYRTFTHIDVRAGKARW